MEVERLALLLRQRLGFESLDDADGACSLGAGADAVVVAGFGAEGVRRLDVGFALDGDWRCALALAAGEADGELAFDGASADSAGVMVLVVSHRWHSQRQPNVYEKVVWRWQKQT